MSLAAKAVIHTGWFAGETGIGGAMNRTQLPGKPQSVSELHGARSRRQRGRSRGPLSSQVPSARLHVDTQEPDAQSAFDLQSESVSSHRLSVARVAPFPMGKRWLWPKPFHP